MYKGLGHVAIRTRDIEESLHFYKDILGFEEAFRLNDANGSLWIIYLSIAPGQFIELFLNGTVPTPKNDQIIGFTHVCLEVENVEKAFEVLKAKGAPIDHEIGSGRSGSRQFWTHDPDGNPIEVMQLPPESLQAQAIKRLMEAKADQS